jgi:hypothetical protein
MRKVCKIVYLILLFCVAVFFHAIDYGPDAFGYIATDNTSPLAPDAPGFSPDDVVAGGTPVEGLGDDNCVPVSLPFDFVFYGITYNQVFVCSNGFLKFADGNFTHNFVGLDPVTNQIINDPIPSTKYPAGIFFWFLDLDPTKAGAGGVFFLESDPDGTPNSGDEHFTIQYDSIPYIDGNFPIIIQIQLWNKTNQIVIHYINAPNPPNVKHVIGIQDAGATSGVFYEYLARSIPAGRTIRFVFPPLDMPSGFHVNDSINTAQLGRSGSKIILNTFEPAFSAVFQSSDATDVAKNFSLQISNNRDFQVWVDINGNGVCDSADIGWEDKNNNGKCDAGEEGEVITVFGAMSDVEAFTRSPDIVFSGPALRAGKEYFYRITFFNKEGLRSKTLSRGSSSFCIFSCSQAGLGAPFVGAGGTSVGCFIATKTLHNKNKLSPFYWIRNNILIENKIGKTILKVYYMNAQKIYSLFGRLLGIVTSSLYAYLNFMFSLSAVAKIALLLVFVAILGIRIRWRN